jgi:hypothetical protein
MGAWGMKAFENDGAGDFFAELSHADGGELSLLMESFDDLDESYIEVDEGQRAVAAAAIVLFQSGGSDDHLSDFQRPWVTAHPMPEAKAMVPAAIAALDLVVSDAETSELYELWEEADDFEEWLGEVNALKAELQSLL